MLTILPFVLCGRFLLLFPLVKCYPSQNCIFFVHCAREGEPFWESPCGRERPGCHIDCSAMSGHYLGHAFDIHGGGKDLIFPHHENELAQSRAANPESEVKCWMHNGFINIDDQKMSKSVNNFFTIRDVRRWIPDSF